MIEEVAITDSEHPGSTLYTWTWDDLYLTVYRRATSYGRAMVDIGWATSYNIRADLNDKQLKLILL